MEIRSMFFLERQAKNEKKMTAKIIVEPLVHVVVFEPRHFLSMQWRMENFKMTSENHLKENSFSETVYSSERDFRMKLAFSISITIDVRLCFLKGPWDSLLPKIFTHKIIMTFVNRDDSSGAKDTAFTMDTDSLKRDTFYRIINNTDLQKCLKNDTLLIRLTVQS